MIIVCPAAFSCSTIAEELLHDRRGEPERQFVDDEQFGFVQHDAAERQHLLLAAREVTGPHVAPGCEGREQVEDAVDPSLDVGAIASVAVGADEQVVADRERREHAGAAGQHLDAETGTLLRRCEGDRPAVEAYDAAFGGHSPVITLRMVDLPAPFVPSSASTSPLRTSKESRTGSARRRS